MVWVDRQGRPAGTVGPLGNYRGLDLSPGGTRVAAHRHDGQGGDIWLTELVRGTTSRFTFDASQDNSSPIWSPDGSQIVFGSLRAGKWGVYRKLSNGGAGSEERLIASDVQVLPMSWSPDGRSIVYESTDPKTFGDLWVLPLAADRKPTALLHTQFQESHGQISPDGKWLAYHSFETGLNEIYVQPFPAGVDKWKVSTNGGTFARWRRDGRELFDTGHVSRRDNAGPYHTFAVSPDGQRFLIPRPESTAATETASPIVVVLNWAEGIRK